MFETLHSSPTNACMAVSGPVLDTPGTPAAARASDDTVPIIDGYEPYAVNKVSAAITCVIELAYTYEHLRPL